MILFSLYSSISSVSYMDEAGHHDENPRHAVQMENTYQLGKSRLFFVIKTLKLPRKVTLVADINFPHTINKHGISFLELDFALCLYSICFPRNKKMNVNSDQSEWGCGIMVWYNGVV